MNSTIQLAHGGGGRLTRDLIHDEIVSRFGEGPLRGLPDAASLSSAGQRLIFSTDSFVVKPLFFPGGNIGDLAVHGTVNDIAVSGGQPRWLSLGMILEEGFEIALLRQVLDSVKKSAAECGVSIVTGDTKVVQRGQCDGIYLNTAGIGEALDGFMLGAEHVQTGDLIVCSGNLADHGMAVMAVRDQIHFENGPKSDTGPVHRLVKACGDLSGAVRLMRDPTRGGAAAVLNEWVEDRPFGVLLQEKDLPIAENVRAVAELLGLDPLHAASEGRVLMICDAGAAPEIVRRWRSLPEGAQSAIVGSISAQSGRVVMETLSGGRRLVDLPSGELLPRIC